MKTLRCPHCQGEVGCEVQNIQWSGDTATLHCPHCGHAAKLPQQIVDRLHKPAIHWGGIVRRYWWGPALLLLLASLGIFFWDTPREPVADAEPDIYRPYLENTYFQQLIAQKPKAAQALDQMERIEPYGDGFIGITREAQTLREASDLASAAEASILDAGLIDVTHGGALMPWLTETFPELKEEVTWVQAEGLTAVLAVPDLLLDWNQVPRRTLVAWPAFERFDNVTWEWKIEPHFQAAHPFTQWGVALAKQNGKWGTIDREGNLASSLF